MASPLYAGNAIQNDPVSRTTRHSSRGNTPTRQMIQKRDDDIASSSSPPKPSVAGDESDEAFRCETESQPGMTQTFSSPIAETPIPPPIAQPSSSSNENPVLFDIPPTEYGPIIIDKTKGNDDIENRVARLLGKGSTPQTSTPLVDPLHDQVVANTLDTSLLIDGHDVDDASLCDRLIDDAIAASPLVTQFGATVPTRGLLSGIPNTSSSLTEGESAMGLTSTFESITSTMICESTLTFDEPTIGQPILDHREDVATAEQGEFRQTVEHNMPSCAFMPISDDDEDAPFDESCDHANVRTYDLTEQCALGSNDPPRSRT